jgi:hypothetical protein
MTLAQQMSRRLSYGNAARPRQSVYMGSGTNARVRTHTLFEPNFDAGWPVAMPRFPPGSQLLVQSIEVDTWQYPSYMLTEVSYNSAVISGRWQHSVAGWVRE